MSTPNTAPQIPAISAEDALFHDVTQDPQTTAQRAWSSVEGQVVALESTPKTLPRVGLAEAASQVIGLWPTFSALRAPALARLSTEQAVQTAAALDSLPRWAFALLYVLAQAAGEPDSDVPVQALFSEANGLRTRGLVWSQILENLGQVERGTTKTIKKGYKGRADTVSDLQALSDALAPHRVRIEALQASASADQSLSGDDLDRMAHLAVVLRQHMERAKPAMPWRASLLRIAAEFERNYKAATAALRFHLTLANDDAALASIPSFGSLRDPAPKPSPAKASPPSTP